MARVQMYGSGLTAVSVNFDTLNFGVLYGATIQSATPTFISVKAPNYSGGMQGSGFTFDANSQVIGGMVSSLSLSWQGASITISDIQGVSGPTVLQWISTSANQAALTTLLAGADTIDGSRFGDLIRGLTGSDLISGQGGLDTIFGGEGNDTIAATSLSSGLFAFATNTYLRGDEGDDRIYGGDWFDDINGNMGNDTAYGDKGDDWVVGGKDRDLLNGGVGNDIVYGNMGDDTCYGDAGDDIIRGGQDADTISGGSGADWIAGDRGADTISGGSGGDTFYFFQGAGVDRVIDFNANEGDGVQLDIGVAYTLLQVGADTVIDLGGGDQITLVGVQLATMSGAWLFAK